MAINNAKPFVKWAGGKRQLIDQLTNLYPIELEKGEIKKYIEPFVGGGAVFFELISKYEFDEIILNDINKELILSYKIIQNNVDLLICNLRKLEDKFYSIETQKSKSEMFYEIREQYNIEKELSLYSINTENAAEHAAHFIFLNRTCFNGIYRENKNGFFNVPFGKYIKPKILDVENLKSVSKVLENVKLYSVDFENLKEFMDEKTFVYFDPPYRPLTKTSSFESYNKGGFGDGGQERLANFYKELHDTYAGVKLMLSNSNPKNIDLEDDFFESLYNHDGIKINEVMASRRINSKASGRGEISELLIVNYAE